MNAKISEIIIKKTKEFEESVKYDKDALQLEEEYKKYLEYSVKRLISKDSRFPIDDEELLEKILTDIAQELIDSPIEYKKQFLIKDQYMEKIRSISDTIFNIAIDIKQGKTTRIKIEHIKGIEEKLLLLLEQVQPWNYNEAQRLVSETILELGVIKNPDTDILSLRLGHIYGNKKREGDER